jgi:hypothetical protein
VQYSWVANVCGEEVWIVISVPVVEISEIHQMNPNTNIPGPKSGFLPYVELNLFRKFREASKCGSHVVLLEWPNRRFEKLLRKGDRKKFQLLMRFSGRSNEGRKEGNFTCKMDEDRICGVLGEVRRRYHEAGVLLLVTYSVQWTSCLTANYSVLAVAP